MSQLQSLILLTERASQAILQVYEQPFSVVHKDDDSPLTAADTASHHVLIDGLLKTGLPVLSEEGEGTDWSVRKTWQKYWLIDPLDGTKEFVKKNGEFTVNIALIEDGEPVLGVITAPAWRRFWAADATGAFTGDLFTAELSLKPMHSRPRQNPPTVLMSRSQESLNHLESWLAALGDYQHEDYGSALKFALLAEGKADLYPRLKPCMEWDSAAGHALLRRVGGEIYRWGSLEPLRYNQQADLTNPFFLAVGRAGQTS
jgi:3'(2'), 5'-bisphosphate nucleotidase